MYANFYLNGNDKMATVFEEVLSVQRHNAGLIWLGHVGKDGVHHRHEHPVLVGVACVLNDRHHVGSLLGHVQKVSEKRYGIE